MSHHTRKMRCVLYVLAALAVLTVQCSCGEVIVSSEGRGSWGRRSLDAVLRYAWPNTTFTWVSGAHPNASFAVRSIYGEEPHFEHTLPYITWSSESYAVSPKAYPPIAELTNYITNRTYTYGLHNHSNEVAKLGLYDNPSGTVGANFYVPYVIDAPFVLSAFRHHRDNQRPYWLAYISSNCVKQREHLFNLFRQRLGDGYAHGLGGCSHNRDGVKGVSWFGNGDVYRDYVFALVMENKLVHGYITEKITLAFRGGAIPIYWGSGGIVSEIFNPDAYIWVNSFASWSAVVDHVTELINEPGRKRLRALQTAPVFRDNVVSEYFRVDETPAPPWIQTLGSHLRQMLPSIA